MLVLVFPIEGFIIRSGVASLAFLLRSGIGVVFKFAVAFGSKRAGDEEKECLEVQFR